MTKSNRAFDALATGHSMWRFPRLALLVERAPESEDDRRLRALAEDLAAELPPDDAIQLLVDSGALNLADNAVNGLLDQDRSTQWAQSMHELIDVREAERREEFERRRRTVAARCHRAGLQRPDELTRQVDYRRDDGTFLDGLFSLLESQVAEAEAGREQELRHRLQTAETDNLHREDIEDLIRAGELRLAEVALEGRNNHVRLTAPRLDERPWPHLAEPLPRILQGLADPEFRLPSYNSFVPPPEDTRGHALLAALAAVSAGAAEAEAPFAAAVQQLIANWECQTEVVDGITYADLYLPEVGRLPTLTLRQGRDTVRFAVGTDSGTAQFRLSTEVTENSAGVVDVASLLGLLTRVGTNVRDRDDRLVLFYRAIVKGLPVRDVVDANSFRGTDDDIRRLRVAWLFYLLGYQLSSHQLTAFMDLTGGIPDLIVSLSALAVTRARQSQSDIAISALYDDEDLFDLVIEAIAIDIDEPAVELLVYLVLAGAKSSADATNALSQAMGTLDPPVTINPRYIADLSTALNTARARGYLQEQGDELQLAAIGGLLLLPRELVDTRVLILTAALVTRLREARRTVALERAQADLDEVAWHAQRSIERASLRGSSDLSARVSRCCQDAYDSARQAHASVTIVLELEMDDELQVGTEGFMLRSAVLNLINNAAEAVHGQIEPQVRVVCTYADETVSISVEDNGPGFRPDILRHFLEGAQAPSSKHPGRGSGLETGRVTAEDLGGTFSVDHSELGGAAVIMRFPAGVRSAGVGSQLLNVHTTKP